MGSNPAGAGAGGTSTGARASGIAGGGTLGSKAAGADAGASGAGGGGASGAPTGGTFGSKPIGSAVAVAEGTVIRVPVIAARMSVLRTLFKFFPFAVRARQKQTHRVGRRSLVGA